MNLNKDDLLFEITKIMSNIKHHDFDIGDFKLCKKDSEVVMNALDAFKNIVGSWNRS